MTELSESPGPESAERSESTDLAHPVSPPVAFRRLFGILRIAVGLLVVASIGTQIVDQLAHNAFKPGEYFSYFTIESGLMNIIVLLVGGVYALRRQRDTELWTSIRMSILTYAVVTGVVYNALLRGIPDTGFVGISWPNEVLHVWVPLFIALDWAAAPGRAALPWRRLWFVAVYPLVWLAFTIVRGILIGWFPYPFLEPTGPGGIPSVVVYVLGITVFIIGLAAIAIGISRMRVRTKASG